MQVEVSSRNTDVPSRLRALTERKVARYERFAPDAVRAEVSFGEARNPRVPGHHDCTVTFHLRRELLTAHAHADEPVAALDGALAKLRHQLERAKDRRVSRGRGGRRTARRDRAPS